MKNQLLAALCASLWLTPMLLATPSEAQAQNRAPRPQRDGDGPPRGPQFRPGAKGQLQGFWHDLDHLDEAGQPVSKVQAAKIVALVRPWTTKPRMTDAEAQKLLGQLQAVLTSAQRNEIRGPGRFGPPPNGPDDARRRPQGGDGGRGEGGRGGRRDDGFGPPPPDGFGDGPPEGRLPRGNRPDSNRPDGNRPDGNRPDGNRPPRDEGRIGGDFGAPPAPPTAVERAAGRAFLDGSNPFYAPTGYSSWKTLPSRMQQDVSRHFRAFRATLERLSRQAKG